MIRKLRTRIKVCYSILFGKNTSWMLIALKDKKDLENLIFDNDVDIKIIFEGLQKYNTMQLMKLMGDNIEEVDLILNKAHFEASAEYFNLTGKLLEE